MSEAMLEFREVDVFYGPIQALRQVSLQVNAGETVALIGANGAGKSTLLMSIFGQPRIAGRQILLAARTSAAAPHTTWRPAASRRRRRGGIFPDMSVEENLLMGTITVGNRYLEEDLPRMFELFPRLRSGATSGR